MASNPNQSSSKKAKSKRPFKGSSMPPPVMQFPTMANPTHPGFSTGFPTGLDQQGAFQPWQSTQSPPGPPYYASGHDIPFEFNYQTTQASDTQPAGSSDPSVQNTIPPSDNPFIEWYTEEEMTLLKNRKSKCWQYFLLSKDGEKAKCKTCGNIYSAPAKGGTGHLNRHSEKCGAPSTDPTQPKISQFHPYGFTYNYERDRDELGRMIVQAEQPFLFAESDPFNNYIKRALQPQHKKISRKTVKTAAMKTYLEYKMKLIEELKTLTSRVSITSDAWDGGYGLHYLCVTCHWVDSEWLLQKRIIYFKLLEYPHTAFNISNCIMSALDEYCLRDKIMSMTFDNATSMTASANLIKPNLYNVIMDGDALHIRCICHVLNLCVKDGQEAIGPYYSKIRNAVLSIMSSSSRYQEWRRYLKQNKIKPIRIKTDCPTRWNSTYDMLSQALSYRVPFSLFYNNKYPQFMIADSDWDNCEKYMQFLQLLYSMTHCFSSVYVPCIHSFLQNACLFAQLLYEHRSQQDYNDYVPQMEAKWRKYYTKLPMVYMFASILDPRSKYDGTFMLIDIYYECMQLGDGVEQYKNHVKDKFFELYRVYESKYGTVTHFAPSQTSKSVSKTGKSLAAQAANMLSKFSGSGSSSRRTQSDVSELQMYLNYDFMKGLDEDSRLGMDILDWWKSQSTKHPILAAMARDIFSIQASSVASERAFSASGRVLDDRRTSLKPETLEMCVCLKDWMDAQERIQDRTFTANDNIDGSDRSGSTSSSALASEHEAEDEDEEDNEDLD